MTFKVHTFVAFSEYMNFNLLFFQPPKENKGRRGGSGVPEPAYCGRCDQHFNNPRYLLLHYKGGLISENISNLIPSSKFEQNHFSNLFR